MKIILADDDRDNRTIIKNFLVRLGHQVIEAENGKQVLEAIDKNDVKLLLTDIKMPVLSGLELLRSLKKTRCCLKVVLFTAYSDMDTAIEALRLGAFDYLQKPVSADDLVNIMEKVEEDSSSINSNDILLPFTGNIGVFSDKMREITMMAKKYHNHREIPVLIEGETGTGKEVLAQFIHNGEGLNPRPFVDINCAAISPNLFESELFGYEAGAFTGGATRGQKGKFDLAMGGTIFLDEIGDIPLEQQVKLLRVLQEREFYRVGGLTKIKLDVRIICATNSNLESAMKEGKFRADLYFRLKVGHINLPPLRQRREEIIPLANHFLHKFAEAANKKSPVFTQEASNLLLSYCWPGNIRELRNLAEMLVYMVDDKEITPAHLKNFLIIKDTSSENDYLPSTLREITELRINTALVNNNGNKAAAARQLGISRRSLYRLLEHVEKRDTVI